MPENRFKALFQRALRAQKEEDLEEALRIWRGILVMQPDYVPALNNMGIALRRLGRIAESEAVLRTGLERAPQSAELWISLGRTLAHWGVADEAVTAVRKALVLEPQSAPAHFAMGQLLDQGGRAVFGVHPRRPARGDGSVHLVGVPEGAGSPVAGSVPEGAGSLVAGSSGASGGQGTLRGGGGLQRAPSGHFVSRCS